MDNRLYDQDDGRRVRRVRACRHMWVAGMAVGVTVALLLAACLGVMIALL